MWSIYMMGYYSATEKNKIDRETGETGNYQIK